MMNRSRIIILFLIAVILVVSIPYLIETFYLPNYSSVFSLHHPWVNLIKVDPYLPIKTIIALINIGLIIPLLYTYIKIYRNMPNKFTLGLLLIMISLLLYAITASPIMTHMLGLHSFNEGPFQFLPNLFTTIALMVLVKVSIE